MRRGGHDHAVSDDRQAERRPQVFVLDEHLDAVGRAVAIGVLENQDSIASPVGQRVQFRRVELPVIHRLRNPDAAARIDVDIRRVEECRRLGPQPDFQVRVEDELVIDGPRTADRAGDQQHGAERDSNSGTRHRR